MVIPNWEVMCRETLSLAEMKMTVPLVRVMSASAAVAVASPSTTRRRPAESSGATLYLFTDGGTWGGRTAGRRGRRNSQ